MRQKNYRSPLPLFAAHRALISGGDYRAPSTGENVMKSHRAFALATSLFAITLAVMPMNASALTRKAGGSNLIYLQYSTAASTSPTATIMRVVAMVIDYLG
jgi:hypothetical protein